MRASGETRTLTPVEGTSVWDWRVFRSATGAWTPRTCRGACAEGGEHDSQRVTPSHHLANDPGAPVRFTLQEGRRGCVSEAQLRVQESNLGGLESESRWDAGNPTRIVFTRRWPESNRHSPKAPLCRRMVDRSPTASWIRAGLGSESNRRPPLYERGALHQLSYQGGMSCLTDFLRAPPGNRTRHLLLTKEVLYH